MSLWTLIIFVDIALPSLRTQVINGLKLAPYYFLSFPQGAVPISSMHGNMSATRVILRACMAFA